MVKKAVIAIQLISVQLIQVKKDQTKFLLLTPNFREKDNT
jgi:hypothetical protein